MLFFGWARPTDPLPYVTGPEIGGEIPSYEQKVMILYEAITNAIRILETNRNCYDILSGRAAANPLDLLRYLRNSGRIVIGGAADGTIAQVMGPNGADDQALGASYDGYIYLFDHFFGIVNNRDYAVNSTTDQRTLTILHELGHLTAAPLIDGIWHWGPISSSTYDTALAARCGIDTGF